jgi:hypothetical protein
MSAATGLRWLDTLTPQRPAITIATMVVTALWGIDVVLAPRAGSMVILFAQATAGALIALGFGVWCPFRDARVLFHDAVHDYFPRLATRLWPDVAATQQENKQANRRRRRGVREAASEAQPSSTS